MMAQIKPQTKEEYNERQRRHELYNYYGIPYGVFDERDLPDCVERDWSEAIVLISQGKNIPKDLEQRLLKYKNDQVKQEERSASTKEKNICGGV